MIRDILSIFVNAASDKNLIYWLDSSSLVQSSYGLAQKNPINVNICINSLDEYDFLDMRYDLEQHKLHIQSHEGGYKIVPALQFKPSHETDTCSQRIDGDNLSDTPSINILIIEENNNRTYYRNNYLNIKWPNHYHLTKDLYPLKYYKLYGLTVSGPNNPIPYINRAYKTI